MMMKLDVAKVIKLEGVGDGGGGRWRNDRRNKYR